MIPSSFWGSLDGVGFQAARMFLSLLWQSSILLAAVGMLAWFLRKRSAAIRHKLWLAALLAVPLLPLLGWAAAGIGTPRAPLAVVPAYAPPEDLFPALPDLAPSSGINRDMLPAGAPGAMPTAELPQRSAGNYPWAMGFLLYSIGAAFLLLLVGLGRRRIGRWILDGRVVTDARALEAFRAAARDLGLTRRFILVENREVGASLALGILHPVILLPAGFLRELSDVELRAVAVHELAHIRRHDPAALTLVSLLRAALFFHPLVWLGARQVSTLAEQAADDAVLAATGEPISYAKMLARLAEGLPSRALPIELAAGILFSRSAFLRRVEAILSDRREQLRKLSRIALAATVLSLLISLAVAIAVPLGEKEKPKAAAEPTAGAAAEAVVPGRFAATFPGGGTVEVMAVSNNPSKGQPWWKPDGSLLDNPPIIAPGGSSKSDNMKSYEIVYRTSGSPKGDDPHWIPASGASTAGGVKLPDGRIDPDLIWTASHFSKEAQKGDVKFGLSTGTWQTDGENGAAGAGMEERNREGESLAVSFTKGYEEAGKAAVTVTHTIRNSDVDVRVVAIDDKGREHRSVGVGSSGNTQYKQMTVSFDVPLAQVRCFRLQTRPIQWVEFHDVALAPKAGQAAPQPRFQGTVFINNIKYGPDNGASSPLGPVGKMTCGQPGAVSEVTWQFKGNQDGKDLYAFERRFPVDGPTPSTEQKEIAYAGDELAIFQDDTQRIFIRPLAPPDYSAMVESEGLRTPTPEEIQKLGALWPSVPPKENAAFRLAEAARLVAPVDKIPAGSSSARPEDGPYAGNVKGFEEWIKLNEPALNALQDGLRLNICQYPVFIEAETGRPVPDLASLARFRHLARTCADAGFLAELQGRPDAALDRYADCLRLGMALRQRGPMIQELVGLAVSAIGQKNMDAVVANGELSGQALQSVIRACRESEARADEPATWWATEVAYGESLMALSEEKEPRNALVNDMWRKQRAAVTEIVAKASLSQLLQPDVRKQMQEIGTKEPGVVQDLTMPAIVRAFEELGRLDVRLRATQIRAAIRLYEKAHGGQLPDKLDALCPEILPSVPMDPFSGKPMRYTKTPEGWKVWSVGADNVDNGGAVDEKLYDADKGHVWDGPDYVFRSDIAPNIEVRSGGQIKNIAPLPATTSFTPVRPCAVELLASDDYLKGPWRWKITPGGPVQIMHGWYTVVDGRVTGNVATGHTWPPHTAPIELGWSTAVEGNMLLVTREEARHDTTVKGNDKIAGKVEIPPDAVFRADCFPCPETLGMEARTLWRGDWVRDGKIVKSVIFAAHLADPDDKDAMFRPPESGWDEPVTQPQDLTAADKAFWECMQKDASYSSVIGFHPQKEAIAEWSRFLERDDLTKEMRVFAHWRIGSLYGYNLDGAAGEKHDDERSGAALLAALAVDPQLISHETLNARTVYASGVPSVTERARRYAEQYRYVMSVDPTWIDASAERVDGNGMLHPAFIHPGATRKSPAEKRQLLLSLIQDTRRSMERHMIELAMAGDEGQQARAYLLTTLADIASPELLKGLENPGLAAAAAVTPRALVFGPVIEQTVNHSGDNCLIDFDTGKLFSGDIPEKVRVQGSKAVSEWVAEQGIDAGGGMQPEIMGLIGFDLIAFPAPNEDWDRKTPQSLLADRENAFRSSKPGNPAYLSTKGAVPATWTFQTRESAIGILQILGFTDNPKGVKIRYRLIPGPAATADIVPTTIEDGQQKGKYAWRVTPHSPLRIVHGWYTEVDGVIKETVGGPPDREPSAAPADLESRSEWAGDVLDVTAARSYTSPKGSVHTDSVRGGTAIPEGSSFRTSFLREPAQLTRRHLPLWRGDFVRDGKVVKSIIYAAYVVTLVDETNDTDFRPPRAGSQLPVKDAALAAPGGTAKEPAKPPARIEVSVQLVRPDEEMMKKLPSVPSTKPQGSAGLRLTSGSPLLENTDWGDKALAKASVTVESGSKGSVLLRTANPEDPKKGVATFRTDLAPVLSADGKYVTVSLAVSRDDVTPDGGRSQSVDSTVRLPLNRAALTGFIGESGAADAFCLIVGVRMAEEGAAATATPPAPVP